MLPAKSSVASASIRPSYSISGGSNPQIVTVIKTLCPELQLNSEDAAFLRCAYEGCSKNEIAAKHEPLKNDAPQNCVTIADFVVRSHSSSCEHKRHVMEPVEASVMVVHQYGYNVSKAEGLSAAQRRAKVFLNQPKKLLRTCNLGLQHSRTMST